MVRDNIAMGFAYIAVALFYLIAIPIIIVLSIFTHIHKIWRVK